MSDKDKNKRIAERFFEQSQNMHFEHTEDINPENTEHKYKIVDVDSMDEFLKLIGKKHKDED